MADISPELIQQGTLAYNELIAKLNIWDYRFQGKNLKKPCWCSERRYSMMESVCYNETIRELRAKQFSREENSELNRGFLCNEVIASQCPLRRYAPKPKHTPQKWIVKKCKYCGGKHRARQAYLYCKAYYQWAALRDKDLKNVLNWRPEGSKEVFWSRDVLSSKLFSAVRDRLWPSLAYAVMQRDNKTCQDCGITEDQISDYSNDLRKRYQSHLAYEQYRAAVAERPQSFEVHHIIARSKGGSDHPANLKTLCNKCHAKCTAELRSDLAEERRVNHVHDRLKVADLTSFVDSECLPTPPPNGNAGPSSASPDDSLGKRLPT